MSKINRRDALKMSGLTAGAVMTGGALSGMSMRKGEGGGVVDRPRVVCGDGSNPEIRRHLLQTFFIPGEELAPNEMRICFMGTAFSPRLGQACNSIFIELGSGECFVFDCGSGVVMKYICMGVPYSKMTRVFLTHLHGDHMSDLTTIYCFGPANDRKTPLHVYGPSGPYFDDVVPPVEVPEEGTTAFCQNLYNLCRWHRESFSFLPTGLTTGEDGYTIIPHETNYRTIGSRNNYIYPDSTFTSLAKVWSYPSIHAREGAVGYVLEWNGLRVLFTGDSLPNQQMVDQANQFGEPLDVLISEMALDPEVWVNKMAALKRGDPGYWEAVAGNKEVQLSSHTPMKMFGYMLGMTNPRLAVGTHCFLNNDVWVHAVDEIRAYYPQGDLAFAVDGMVLNLIKGQPIQQRMAIYSDFTWPMENIKSYNNPAPPKYHGPRAQFSQFSKNLIINPPYEK